MKVVKVILSIIAVLVILGIIGSCFLNITEDITKTDDAVKKLKVLSAEVKREGFSYYIVGKVKNNSKHKFAYVQIEFNVYGSNGELVESTMANINNLEPGAGWQFRAPILADEFKSVKFIGVSGW